MKNRAITLGCTATLYCPNDFVRRDQMAAFLYRLGVQNAFMTGGNAFGATAVLGTTDNNALYVRVNNGTVMRYLPGSISPNLVGGHAGNSAQAGASAATVAGGGWPGNDCWDATTGQSTRSCANHAGPGATVGGGRANAALGDYATIAGGVGNTASDDSGSVLGGSGNTASGYLSTVTGGGNNVASAYISTVLAGANNVASGNHSTVVGGIGNMATGDFSFAAGNEAHADQPGCFVFANWSTLSGGSCLGTSRVARFLLNHGLSVDYFSRRADGGGTRWVYFGDLFAGQTIATWTGAFLSDAGVWVNAASSQTRKTGFANVDARDILEKVARMPITTWSYKEGEPGIRHIGPMSEDFHAAFQVGYGPHTIADLDARGVALAAIQGVNAKLEAALDARDAEIAALRDRLARSERAHAREIDDLRTAMAALFARMTREDRVALGR